MVANLASSNEYTLCGRLRATLLPGLVVLRSAGSIAQVRVLSELLPPHRLCEESV